MKLIFRNTECIILLEEKGEAHTEGTESLLQIAKPINDDIVAKGGSIDGSIVSVVNAAYEIWIYKKYTKTFHAFKNKGLIDEIIHRLSEHDINVKSSAAGMDGVTTEVRFCSDKDEFLFNLKFL